MHISTSRESRLIIVITPIRANNTDQLPVAKKQPNPVYLPSKVHPVCLCVL